MAHACGGPHGVATAARRGHRSLRDPLLLLHRGTLQSATASSHRADRSTAERSLLLGTSHISLVPNGAGLRTSLLLRRCRLALLLWSLAALFPPFAWQGGCAATSAAAPTIAAAPPRLCMLCVLPACTVMSAAASLSMFASSSCVISKHAIGRCPPSLPWLRATPGPRALVLSDDGWRRSLQYQPM